MHGEREFTNHSCVDLIVILTVRSGDKVGCTAKTEKFCLKRSERCCIIFGNEHNSYLDGIKVYSCDHCQYTETKLCVEKCGTPIDKLLNSHHHITFLMAGECIVVSNYKC